jgi:hypothetical protein
MTHLSEEQLILHYYRESDASEHLQACEPCRAEFERLAEALDACNHYTVPERPAEYETMLWQRIAPEFRTRATAWWKRPFVLAPVLTGLLVAAFFAGRFSTHSQPPAMMAVADMISEQGRQKILMVALGDHLERSQMVLMEIANAQPGDKIDMHLARQRAQDLVSENRLYRQTSVLAGDSEFSGLLDELERVLTDIANGPSQLSSTELAEIQSRIESRGLIFKVRVVGTNLQQKGTKQL